MKLLLHFLMGGIYGDIPVKSCTIEGIYKQSKLKKIISPYNPILDNELPMLSIVNCILFLKKKKGMNLVTLWKFMHSVEPMQVWLLVDQSTKSPHTSKIVVICSLSFVITSTRAWEVDFLPCVQDHQVGFQLLVPLHLYHVCQLHPCVNNRVYGQNLW